MSEHLTEEELHALVQEQRGHVTAPAELWPLVAASTIHLGAVRRQVLRSMRGTLLVAAAVLVAASALVTWRVARWAMTPDTPASPPAAGAAGAGGAGGTHAPHAGHPTTTRRPQDGPPAPPRPPRPIPPQSGPRPPL